jgi:hypothetical protein
MPYLQVDGRFLTAGGEPFFWLTDTAWAMRGKLGTHYLDVRAAHGFNVVQTVARFPRAESPGDTVEAAAENDEYRATVEFAIAVAAARGGTNRICR